MPPPVYPSDAPRRTRRSLVVALVGGLVAYRLVFYVALLALMGLFYGRWGGDAFQALTLDRARYVWPYLVANALGQAVGLGGAAWWLAAHEDAVPARYLRLGGWTGTGWAVAGIVGLMPLVQLLGVFNGWIVLPEAWKAEEAAQTALLAHVLSEGPLVLNLLLLAAVPALFEELFFRGYVQRRLEVGGDVAVAVLLSGLAFGLYHLRFGQLLPLTLVGLYLAYVVVATGRLGPAIAAHFCYNALLVTLAALGHDPSALPTQGWLALPGLAVTIWALRQLRPDAPAPRP